MIKKKGKLLWLFKMLQWYRHGTGLCSSILQTPCESFQFPTTWIAQRPRILPTALLHSRADTNCAAHLGFGPVASSDTLSERKTIWTKVTWGQSSSCSSHTIIPFYAPQPRFNIGNGEDEKPVKSTGAILSPKGINHQSKNISGNISCALSEQIKVYVKNLLSKWNVFLSLCFLETFKTFPYSRQQTARDVRAQEGDLRLILFPFIPQKESITLVM